ncbi:MAG: hypothetical protein PVG55_04895, partial [Nitrospirota bacterium]
MGLQKKAVLMLAVLLFLAVGLNTVVLTFIAVDKYKSVLLSKGVSVAESLKGDLEKVLALGVPLEYVEDMDDRLAGLLAEDDTLEYAMVAGPGGDILFHTERGAKAPALGVELSVIPEDSPFIRESDRAFEVAFSLMDAEGKPAGAVVLGI